MTEPVATPRCAACGAGAPSDALGWSTQDEDGRRSVLCPACSRDHARSIEARLDPRWW